MRKIFNHFAHAAFGAWVLVMQQIAAHGAAAPSVGVATTLFVIAVGFSFLADHV
ncbi:MAG TPA: hypothetical protein PLO69_05135 [Gammaproteobacteria bacterium]|nr:hypothetical protein [Gammaproteobacteria bacterium]